MWHEYPELARGVLSNEQWKNVIAEAFSKGCKSFLLTGGEPLLRPNWQELVKYALSFPEVKVDIFTNASRMTEDILQFLKTHKVGISTSLQGLRSYAEMTGTKRRFYKSIEFIARCREINYPCSVGITVTAINLFEIADIVSAATFAGASAIQLSVFLNAGRGKNNVNLQLNHLQWLQVKDQIRNLNAPIPIMYCDEFECKCMNDDTFNCPGWDCFGTVSPNGVYRKCLHYYKPKN
jgi:MoaA/NifB/PqqE/SkfB family radical SAM enzyme